MEDLADFADLIKTREFQALLLLLTLCVLLIAVWRLLLGGQRGNTVLVLGASGSGKTTLFYQLRDGSAHHGTVPSMQTNEDAVQLKFEQGSAGKGAGKVVDLVDVPGHPKVRGKAVQFYSRATKIMFLVDAVDFMAQKTDVAEQLYEVLSDKTIQKRRVPLLLVCNKTDLGTKAHTSDFLRKRLEKEVEALRSTRATLGEAALQGLNLAKSGEAFTFAKLKSPKVSIASGSALAGDLKEVVEFLK